MSKEKLQEILSKWHEENASDITGGREYFLKISRDLEGIILNAFATKSESLDLSGLAIFSLPAEIFRYFPFLKKLDLSYNNFHEVPDGIEELDNLEFLNLSHNNIESVPDFAGFENLENIDISNNQINSLPEKFFAGDKLTINASKNPLDESDRVRASISSNLIFDIDSDNLAEDTFEEIRKRKNMRPSSYAHLPKTEEFDKRTETDYYKFPR